MEHQTLLAAIDAVNQILLGMNVEEKMCVLGGATAVLIVNEANSHREIDVMTDLFTESLNGTVTEMMEKKEAHDVYG